MDLLYLPGGRLDGGNESSVSGGERLSPFSLPIFRRLSFF